MKLYRMCALPRGTSQQRVIAIEALSRSRQLLPHSARRRIRPTPPESRQRRCGAIFPHLAGLSSKAEISRQRLPSVIASNGTLPIWV
jgi:hypothetical protein